VNNTEIKIELKDVVKAFKGNSRSFKALKGINLTIKKGELTVITGKSGSGKTTFLNMITCIDHPTSGDVIVDKMSINNLRSNKLASWRGCNVGIVFQFFQLMPTLTILENVMLPMEFARKIPQRQQKERALKLLDKVDVKDHADKFPNMISGGEKQRVAIVRAFANDPGLLVADEPTGNLDSQNSNIIHNLINNLAHEGKTIVYVTHEKEINLNYSKILELLDGRVVN